MAKAATANEDAKLVEKVKRLRDSEQERSKHEIWEKVRTTLTNVTKLIQLYQIITELHSSLNQQQTEEIKCLTTTIAVLKFQVKEQ